MHSGGKCMPVTLNPRSTSNMTGTQNIPTILKLVPKSGECLGQGLKPTFWGHWFTFPFPLVIRLVWKGKVSSRRELCVATRTLWRHSMCFLLTWVHMQVLENRARFARTVLAGVFRDAGYFHRITVESLEL